MSRRVLSCDRPRYIATVAALLAVYGAIVVMDWLARVVRREPVIGADGQYPWERGES